MTQLFLDDAGQRALPVLSPLQQGVGTRVDSRESDRVTRGDERARFNDVIELDRRIDAEEDDLVFEPRTYRRPSDFTPPDQGFTDPPPERFSFDRDVVANIYAANESGAATPVGSTLDLVA